MNCAFFDSGTVIATSKTDGIHLESDAHIALGKALVPTIAAIINHPDWKHDV